MEMGMTTLGDSILESIIIKGDIASHGYILCVCFQFAPNIQMITEYRVHTQNSCNSLYHTSTSFKLPA